MQLPIQQAGDSDARCKSRLNCREAADHALGYPSDFLGPCVGQLWYGREYSSGSVCCSCATLRLYQGFPVDRGGGGGGEGGGNLVSKLVMIARMYVRSIDHCLWKLICTLFLEGY